MTTTAIPEYLTPAFQQLDAARAAHLESARQMDDTTTAIARTAEQKAEIEKENGSDASVWRRAFRAGGAVLTDELNNSIWHAWPPASWCRNATGWLRCWPMTATA